MDCYLILDGIKQESVDNIIRWLRATNRITTRRTTRGIILTVCKYKRFQSLGSYKNDTTNDTTNEILTTQERLYTQECKNGIKNIEGKKPPSPSKKKKGDWRVKDFVFVWWPKTYLALQGKAYIPTGADPKLVQKLLRQYDAEYKERAYELLKGSAREYLRLPDSWHEKKGYSIGCFASNINAFTPKIE